LVQPAKPLAWIALQGDHRWRPASAEPRQTDHNARPAPDARREAAAIAAADTVLNSLYPDLKALFDAEYQDSLAAIPKNKPTADGIAWGQIVANAVLAWRGRYCVNRVCKPPPFL
jgi:hypothetical protein